MDQDLARARALLAEGGSTCVLCRGPETYHSSLRGIAPLLELTQQQTEGFSAADKVVGKAAALMYCLLGVRQVYGSVMSLGALQILESHRIGAFYGTLTDRILNRSRQGLCPMEQAVADISDPEAAKDAILAVLRRLQ